MKKWLLFFVILVLLSFTAIYLFIPNIIKLETHLTVVNYRNGLYRKLGDKTEWVRWWPGVKKEKTHNGKLDFNGLTYELADKQELSFSVAANGNLIHNISTLSIIPSQKDSTLLDWNAVVPTSYNPIRRLGIYLEAGKYHEGMKRILSQIGNYYGETRNVYDLDIRQELVRDSGLISTYAEANTYPSVELIYGLIGELKSYIKAQGALEKGNPMLNIYKEGGSSYLVRVDIPVDRRLANSGKFTYKWMLMGGNILIADVKGGNDSIAAAFRKMEYYIEDHHRVAPAIPFLSLTTDRSKEIDSTKWITRIYYPVM